MKQRYCMKLTGKQRYRVGWFGGLILQVEFTYLYKAAFYEDAETQTAWRDATIEDLKPEVVV